MLEALRHLNPATVTAPLDLLDEHPRWLKKEHETSGVVDDGVDRVVVDSAGLSG